MKRSNHNIDDTLSQALRRNDKAKAKLQRSLRRAARLNKEARHSA